MKKNQKMTAQQIAEIKEKSKVTIQVVEHLKPVVIHLNENVSAFIFAGTLYWQDGQIVKSDNVIAENRQRSLIFSTCRNPLFWNGHGGDCYAY